MEKMKKIWSLMMMALIVAGCGGSDDAVANKDFLRSGDVTVAGEEERAVIRVEANCPWTIATQDTWLSLSVNSGMGNAEVVVGMSVNPSSTEARTGYVTLASAGGVVTRLSVRQEAGHLPILSVVLVSDVDDEQATLTSGVLESLLPISEYGFCIAETMHPTVDDMKVIAVQDNTSPESFRTVVSGLMGGTRYYVRAYAVNAAGTAYSEEVDFVTALSPNNDDIGRPNFARKH